MRLAVFTNQFPGRVNTFFARDVRALIDAGIEVEIFPIYPLDETLYRCVPSILGPEVFDRRRVRHISPSRSLSWGRPGSAAALRDGVTELLSVTRSAVRFGLRPLLKSLYVINKAWAWYQTMEGRFDHVLSYWGNYAATCAYLFHRWSCGHTPFTVFLHAGTDLYRDQVYLREKLRYADQVVVVCEFNRQFLKRLLPADFEKISPKIITHHLGVYLDELPFTSAGRSQTTVLGVGSHDRRKGFDYLLRAVALLRGEGVEVELELVGQGPQTARLERLASELGIRKHVSFRGWQPFAEVVGAMKRATVLAHTSPDLGDAVPTVIKEALALGTPVLGTNVAGIPELLDDGRCGLLVVPRDVAAVARGLRHLLTNPGARQHFSVAGRRFAEEMFDQRANGKRLAEVLRSACRITEPSPHDPMVNTVMDSRV